MKKFKFLGKYILIYLGIVLLFLLVNIISYGIPNNNIQTNIKNSVPVLLNEGNYYNPIFKDNIGHQLDNFTDALIIGTAYDDCGKSHNLLECSVLNARLYVNQDPLGSLVMSVNGDEETNENYTRYWMGSSSLIRFLFMFLNIQQIRYLNMFIMVVVLAVAFYFIAKKLNFVYGIIYLFAVFLMDVFLIPLSIQFFPVTLTAIVGSIAVVLLYNSKYKNKMPFLFTIVGMVTSYLDLLTFPLITYGLSMIVYLMCYSLESKISYKESVGNIFIYGMLWSLGYFGTFFMKWALASLITLSDQFKPALDAFIFRTNMTGEKISLINVFDVNTSIIFTDMLKTILIVFTIIVALLLIKFRNKKIDIKIIISTILLGVTPFAWYMIFSNHSFVHKFMTYRILIVSVVSLLFLEAYLVDWNKLFKKLKLIKK